MSVGESPQGLSYLNEIKSLKELFWVILKHGDHRGFQSVPELLIIVVKEGGTLRQVRQIRPRFELREHVSVEDV